MEGTRPTGSMGRLHLWQIIMFKTVIKVVSLPRISQLKRSPPTARVNIKLHALYRTCSRFNLQLENYIVSHGKHLVQKYSLPSYSVA